MTRNEKLAAAVRRLRTERGWDLRQAGKAFGRHPSAVCRWESSKQLKPPEPSRIAQAFGVSIEEVLKPCPHCNYQPPLGYMCLTCRTEGGSETNE